MAAALEIQGLPELRKALRQLEPNIRREFRQDTFKRAAVLVATKARPLTPVLTGRLRASLRGTTAGDKAVIRSPLPYANVIHFGGTTGRGHSRTRPGATRIKATPFVTEAVDRNRALIVNTFADGVARTARAHGWKVTRK